MTETDWVALATSPVALAAMAALVYLDAFLVVLPGEVAVTAVGAAATATGSPPLVVVIVVAATAAFAGDASCFAVGRLGGGRLRTRPRIRVILDRAQRALDRRGAAVLFTARFVPFARLGVNLAAGAARAPLRIYLPLVAVAATAWAAFQASLGGLLAAILPGGPAVVVAVTVVIALVLGVAVDAVVTVVQRTRRRRSVGGTDVPPAST